MTRTTNARLAGFMFLFYIAVGITSMVLFGRATRGEGTAAQLASIVQHAASVRLTVLLTLLCFVAAVALAVTLYALTRDEDRDLALIALCCRASEGVVGAVSAARTLGLVSVATAAAGASTPDAAAAQALGSLLLQQGAWTGNVAAACFALGSTLFCYLFLRARSISVALAWLGVVSSVLLVVAIPLQLASFLTGPATYLVWIPMALFEVAFALWLLIKGVAAPGAARAGVTSRA
jgi:hypothetical protein